MKPTTQARLMKFVEPVTESGCWLWTGSVDQAGRGRFSLFSKSMHAHRVSYMLFKGLIPDGAVVCHRCDIPSCVNPEHLFLGSQKDNMADCAKKGRTARHWGKKTRCKNGHELNAENTYVRVGKRPGRNCRICVNEAQKRHALKVKGAAQSDGARG